MTVIELLNHLLQCNPDSFVTICSDSDTVDFAINCVETDGERVTIYFMDTQK